jgi:hypothetical protein
MNKGFVTPNEISVICYSKPNGLTDEEKYRSGQKLSLMSQKNGHKSTVR